LKAEVIPMGEVILSIANFSAGNQNGIGDIEADDGIFTL
jgi:hypothetical protein